jgi:hypothetical protein
LFREIVDYAGSYLRNMGSVCRHSGFVVKPFDKAPVLIKKHTITIAESVVHLGYLFVTGPIRVEEMEAKAPHGTHDHIK